MAASRRRQRVDREGAIRRYLELRPVVRARLTASVPLDLHKEFESLTPHQLLALLLLPEDGLSMRRLATALGVMGATVSVLADRLVAQGLAVRMPDPTDRRVVRLAPTERGQALAARAEAQQRRSAADMFDRLSDDQVLAFLDVLETLAEEAPRLDATLTCDDPAVRPAALSPSGPSAPPEAPAAPPAAGSREATRSPAKRSTSAPAVRHGRAIREEAR